MERLALFPRGRRRGFEEAQWEAGRPLIFRDLDFSEAWGGDEPMGLREDLGPGRAHVNCDHGCS